MRELVQPSTKRVDTSKGQYPRKLESQYTKLRKAVEARESVQAKKASAASTDNIEHGNQYRRKSKASQLIQSKSVQAKQNKQVDVLCL